MKTNFKGLASTVTGALVCVAFASCTALGPGSPDLMVESPAVSDDGPAAGTPFTLSAKVRNAGAAATEATTLRYYRSPDATITTSDTEVGTAAIAELAASGTSSESVSLTAPSTAGTYYYGACVDAVEGESDTANNCSSSVQITVPEPEAQMQLGPDLVVSSPSVSNSAPAVGATFTLSATLSNQGDVQSAETTLRYYRSTDATITTTDTEVGTGPVGALSPWVTSGARSISLAAPTTAGTYYYGACVDAIAGESDTANNCSASVQVDVSEPQPGQGGPQTPQRRPDIAPLGVFLASGALDGSPGRSFTFRSFVRNSGDAEAPATTLSFYRSVKRSIEPTDRLVGSVAVGPLAASGGTSSELLLSLTAPTSAGTYYYGACVDPVAGESDTTNNCTLSLTMTVDGPPPDLVVGAASVTAVREDGTFWLGATVRNQGAGGSAATTVRYKRSTDATIATSDTTVGTDEAPTLIPLAGYGATIKLTAPSTPGTYYYGVCADPVRRESDTTNNCSTSVQVVW